MKRLSAEVFDEADATQSPAAWALRYAVSLDGVLTVLSGMSTLSQMEENCKILGEDFKPLTDAEQEMLKNVAKIVEGKKPVLSGYRKKQPARLPKLWKL